MIWAYMENLTQCLHLQTVQSHIKQGYNLLNYQKEIT